MVLPVRAQHGRQEGLITDSEEFDIFHSPGPSAAHFQ